MRAYICWQLESARAQTKKTAFLSSHQETVTGGKCTLIAGYLSQYSATMHLLCSVVGDALE